MAFNATSRRSTVFWQSLLFLSLWMLANTLPWLSMWLVYRALPIAGVAWLVACMLVGIAQWLVLQRYIANIGSWALATCLGGIIGFSGFATSILAMFVAAPLCGLAVGVAQWLILRHKLTGAFWWIVATVVGALVGLGLAYLALPLFGNSYDTQLQYTIFRLGIVIEIVSSWITGSAMLWLLKRNANRKVVNTQPSESF